MKKVSVIGGGLAGAEAAYYLAERGVEVTLYDIKPKKFTPAHTDKNFGELVCSNSLKGNDYLTNACGLLKEEMRILGSLIIRAADETKVEAGGALAVDRREFARYITESLNGKSNLEIVCKEVTKVPESLAIVATGPLTTKSLSLDISNICGGELHFYDASAPIVDRDSIDFNECFFADRYGHGGNDYINCPLTKEEYEVFVHELLHAERVILKDFEKREIFEGCMPIEVLAARGKDSLRFANFKPVGLKDGEGKSHYAVLQLRRENKSATAYNLVGCQTNLKFGEQKRVFSLIPALKRAEFLRYGVMHRNTFIESPKVLDEDFSLKSNKSVFFAGQITGVEGYVESAASGLIAAVNLQRYLSGKESAVPNNFSILGALCEHISTPDKNFQPMNANFGILAPCEKAIKDKKERNAYLARRALNEINKYKEVIL